MYRALICTIVAILSVGAAAQTQDQPVFHAAPIALSSLVDTRSPLHSHNLGFDSNFSALALDYQSHPNPALVLRIAQLPAITHILRHATNYDYDVPKDSPQKLVEHLLKPTSNQAERIATCRQSLAFFSGPMLSNPEWVSDTLRYLPSDFRFNGTLFLTFGYDIGVAFGNTASLNCTHQHFKDNPRELLTYYAIHELHHTGFNRYQPPPRLTDIKTCRDLLQLVQYSTQMEGLAVLARFDAWRRQVSALPKQHGFDKDEAGEGEKPPSPAPHPQNLNQQKVSGMSPV